MQTTAQQMSKKTQQQDFIHEFHEDKDTVLFKQLFNEEHAAMLFEIKLHAKPHFDKVMLKNVGVKIMKDVFEKFQEQGIKEVQLNYNWNDIMMFPKLVCYDKNTWKTLQQLSNWNREWSMIFSHCYSIQKIDANIVCSWADSEYVKAFLQGIAKLPNIRQVNVTVKSKKAEVQQMLNAFSSANIFQSFKGTFVQY